MGPGGGANGSRCGHRGVSTCRLPRLHILRTAKGEQLDRTALSKGAFIPLDLEEWKTLSHFKNIYIYVYIYIF